MKPRQIFTLNFQNDIEGQLNDVTTKQLLKLCIHIMTLLPFNFLIMFEFEEEFSCLFQQFGKALAEVLKFKAHKPITLENMCDISTSDIENENSFLLSFLAGLNQNIKNKPLMTTMYH